MSLHPILPEDLGVPAFDHGKQLRRQEAVTDNLLMLIVENYGTLGSDDGEIDLTPMLAEGVGLLMSEEKIHPNYIRKGLVELSHQHKAAFAEKAHPAGDIGSIIVRVELISINEQD